MCKILALSDLHGYLPDIPPCDLLILAGDYCAGFRDRDWLMGPFTAWLRKRQAKAIVGVAGNHDWEFMRDPDAYRGLPWHYLKDSGVELFGLKIWGSPFTPKFFDWAFMKEDEDLRSNWSQIPEGIDVLVTHGPPKGILDHNALSFKCGSQTLWDRVREVQPSVHLFGHIHEGRGYERIDWGNGKSTQFINCTYVNGSYAPVHEPVDVTDFV